ncbi:hypothetical protein JTB14_015922 [Gonioctena quinquepunctata]|nr:hypothetical protein JTB14_015922 [Gonioctena quinquepunctata]
MPNSPPVFQEISLAGILDFLKRLDQKFDKSQETLAEIKVELQSLKNKNIFVANDLSPEDQIFHRNLRSHLNTAKSHDIKASIRNNKLIIKNNAYSLADLEANPDVLRGEGSNKRKDISSPEESIAKRALRSRAPNNHQ